MPIIEVSQHFLTFHWDIFALWAGIRFYCIHFSESCYSFQKKQIFWAQCLLKNIRSNYTKMHQISSSMSPMGSFRVEHFRTQSTGTLQNFAESKNGIRKVHACATFLLTHRYVEKSIAMFLRFYHNATRNWASVAITPVLSYTFEFYAKRYPTDNLYM